MEKLNNIDTGMVMWALAALAVTVAVFMLIRKVRENMSRGKSEKKAQAYIAALNELIAGRNGRALELFKEAVRFDTENIDAYIKLGMLYRIEGKASQALKIHKELTIRSGLSRPLTVEIYRNIVDDLIELQHYGEAVEFCTKILSLDPKNRWALDRIPRIFEKKRDWKAAFKALKSYADNTEDMNHNLAVYKTAHGKDLMEREQYHDARILFKEAIKYDRSYAPPYLYLGDAYNRQDRREDAMRVWRDFAETVTEKAYLVFHYLDRAYFETGNYGAMEVFLSRIVEKDPDNYHALIRLGEIYFKKGEQDMALEMTERSMKINPKSPEALSNLIMYLNNSEDLQMIKDKAISLAKLVAEPATYECKRCNYKAPDLLVQCPECAGLDTFDF